MREESGLWGARHLDPADLGGAGVWASTSMAGVPSEITIGAVGADRWEVEIVGRAAHAGRTPSSGISATVVAALALAEVFRGGWFGKVKRDGREGTSNVGSVGGRDGRSAGEATNVVTDYALVRGESRSHDIRFAARDHRRLQGGVRGGGEAGGRRPRPAREGQVPHAPRLLPVPAEGQRPGGAARPGRRGVRRHDARSCA